MNLFEKILFFLQGKMEIPVPFGWFHILWLIIAFSFIFLLYKRKEYVSEQQLKIVLGTYGIIAFLLEVFKQLIWSFNYDIVTNVVSWDYSWYSFPFQLCTTPIFVSLICLFMKKCKLRDYLLSYMAYVTILGSVSTMIIPNSCFCSDILVNIHTMWLHFGSFVVSVYLLMSGEVKVNFDYAKKAIVVFIVFVLIANILNISIYKSGILGGETFNMFYISPYFISSLPVFDLIQQSVPYFLYLLIYMWALIIGAVIVYGIAIFIKNILFKKKCVIMYFGRSKNDGKKRIFNRRKL